MKRSLIICCFLLLTVTAFGQWDFAPTGVVEKTQLGRPRIANVSNASDARLAANGWYRLYRDESGIGTNQYAASWFWDRIDGQLSVYLPVVADIPPEPEPTPQRFEVGSDTPMLVLDAPGGQGVGYVVDEAGALVPIVYAHESPYDMDALRVAIVQARTNHAAVKAARITDAQGIGAASASANSVPALRAQVAALAELVEQLIGAQ